MAEAFILPQFMPPTVDLSNYALKSHSHSGYASSSHSHSGYASSSHSHSGYATQTWVTENFAAKGSSSSDPYGSQAIGDGWYWPPVPTSDGIKIAITVVLADGGSSVLCSWIDSTKKWAGNIGSGFSIVIEPGNNFGLISNMVYQIAKWKWG